MEAIIRTERLSKRFGKSSAWAVDEVSLHVGRGEIYGFLGLNGAGKTTTIRMLLGMIKPDSGASYMLEKRVHAGRTDAWAKVGYMVETPYSYPELTVRENLELTRRLRGIANARAVDAIMEKLQLVPYKDRKAKNLSLGNAQRLGLAKAMIHEPEILILDEPTNGLDPAGIVEVREMLRGLAIRQGVTIFLSSHLLGEVTKLATRVGIVHQGRLVKEADVAGLKQGMRRRLLVHTRDPEAARRKLSEAGYAVGRTAEGVMALTGDSAVAYPDRVARLLVQANLPPTLLQVDEEDLETYFLRTIGVEGSVEPV
jgi:ABC-2 type transport system ATP-binding protein